MISVYDLTAADISVVSKTLKIDQLIANTIFDIRNFISVSCFTYNT